MEFMKKLLSLTLVLAIVLLGLPSAFAEESDKYLLYFDFTDNISGWENASNKIFHDADPNDAQNGVCRYSGRQSASAEYINARAFFDDTPEDNKIFTGRVMISQLNDASYDYRLRGNSNISLVAFDKNGNIKVRDVNTGLMWKPGCWINFSVYVAYSNDDKTVCPVTVCLSSEDGILDGDGNPVNTYTDSTKTINLSGYADNFGAEGKNRNSINAQAIFPAGSSGTVYMDDVSVIIPQAPEVYKESLFEPAEYINTLTVSFSHPMDMSNFTADKFVLTDKEGNKYPAKEIKCSYLRADYVTIEFDPIDLSGEYILNMQDIKDASGTPVSSVLKYVVENEGSDPITELSLSTQGSTEQIYGNTSAVEFTAVTTPATGVSLSSIDWYVNGEKQDNVGGYFELTPIHAGTYAVYASVADTGAKSETVNITVMKADPQPLWPTVSVIYEGNRIGDALNNDGEGEGTFSIEDADAAPPANAEGYIKNIIFTPYDTDNYNTVYKSVVIIVNEPSDIAYDTVIINSDCQPFLNLSEAGTIQYTADAEPRLGPDPDSIVWYVNGEKQAASGLTFSFTPQEAGSFYVSAAVANNASANVTGSMLAVLPDEDNPSGDTIYVTDDFSSGNLNKWSNVSGKEEGSGVRVSADPYDNENSVADYYASEKGSTFIGMRQVMDASNPLVMSGRVMLYAMEEDDGGYEARSFSILLRSMVDGYGSNTLLAFNQNNTISLGGVTVGRWNDNKWIDFTVCLVPNGSDPSMCTASAIFCGAEDTSGSGDAFYVSVPVDYSNFAFDNPQIQFNSVIRPNKEGRNHVYLDDFKGLSIGKFEPSLVKDIQVSNTNSLMIIYNHAINAQTAVSDNISVFNTETGEEEEIKAIYTDERMPVYSCLTFYNTLDPNAMYRIDFHSGLKDIAGITSCYESIYFSTGNDEPLPPVEAQIKVNRISVYPENFELPLGFALPCELAVTVSPESATNPTLRWVSSDESVAKVENGFVTGVSMGEAEIQAFATDGSLVSSNKIRVKITEPRQAADNQLINLGEGSGRIDIEKHLSMPENIGEGQVALWNDDKTGAVTITVDDCITGDFEQWMKWTEEYGFPFTFFVPTNSYGTSSWQKDALEELIAAGEDVQSHSYHHYSDTVIETLSSAQSILEFKQPIEAINSLAGAACKAIAYSYGEGDPDYAAQFYIACRGVVPIRLNRADSINYTYINSISMDGRQNITEDNDGNRSLESAIKSLYDKDYLYAGSSYYGGWTSFHTHGLGTLSDSEIIPDQGSVSTADEYKYLFDNYLYPARDEIWVGKFAEVAMYAQERDTATLTMLSSDNNSIRYNLTDLMDDNLFNYPLTVKIKVDPTWENISAVQNGQPVKVTEIIDGENKYILVNSVPDRGIVTVSHDKSISADISIIDGIQCFVKDGNVEITSNIDEEITAYVVTYDDGICRNISADSCTLKAGVPGNIEFVLPSDRTNQEVKLVIWRNNMQPVILPIEY